jgi:hypothetical protein
MKANKFGVFAELSYQNYGQGGQPAAMRVKGGVYPSLRSLHLRDKWINTN